MYKILWKFAFQWKLKRAKIPYAPAVDFYFKFVFSAKYDLCYGGFQFSEDKVVGHHAGENTAFWDWEPD